MHGNFKLNSNMTVGKARSLSKFYREDLDDPKRYDYLKGAFGEDSNKKDDMNIQYPATRKPRNRTARNYYPKGTTFGQVRERMNNKDELTDFEKREIDNQQARIKDTIERSKGKVPVQVGDKWVYVDPKKES